MKSRFDFQEKDLLGLKVMVKRESFSSDSIWIISK